MKRTAVLHLTGKAGVGKSSFLDNLGVVQRIEPSQNGQAFNVAMADFKSFPVVAIDEVLMWDRESIRVGINELEVQAISTGKKLILVTQMSNDLADAGIFLRNGFVKYKIAEL